MSKPIEDPPSLVDVLAREHAARRALIEAECSHALAAAGCTGHTAHDTHDTHADAHAAFDTDVGIVAPLANGSSEMPIVSSPDALRSSDASSPRVLVEELTRKCCERRAALDKEAHRG